MVGKITMYSRFCHSTNLDDRTCQTQTNHRYMYVPYKILPTTTRQRRSTQTCQRRLPLHITITTHRKRVVRETHVPLQRSTVHCQTCGKYSKNVEIRSRPLWTSPNNSDSDDGCGYSICEFRSSYIWKSSSAFFSTFGF